VERTSHIYRVVLFVLTISALLPGMRLEAQARSEVTCAQLRTALRVARAKHSPTDSAEAERHAVRACRGALDARILKHRDPTLTSAIQTPAQVLQLTANTNTKDKTVQAQAGVLFADTRGSTLGAAIDFQGPLDAGDDRTELASTGSLTQLANATTIGLHLNLYHWAPSADTAGLRRYCNQLRSRIKGIDTAPEDISWCVAGGDKVPEKYWDNLSAFFPHPGIPVVVAANAKIGRDDITYTDPNTLADSTIRSTPWSIGVALGLYVPKSAWLVALGYNRVHELKAGKSTQLCSPIGTDGTLRCHTTTFGLPSEQNRDVISAEARRFVSERFGFSIRAECDVKDGTSTIAVPLYFLKNKSSGLTGGVVPEWTSDHRTLTMGVFVGAFAPPIVSAP
jgi:hypothetical protein